MRPDEELPLSRQLPVDEDVARELAHHLAERERELLALGWTPEAAAAEARRTFGNVEAVRHECRDITRRVRRSARRAEGVESWRQDLSLAARLLRKSPGFTAAAVLTLALGIGANAAIFSVVNATLLRPLPYDQPEQLVDLAESHQSGWGNVTWANLLDWRAQSRSFDGMASYGKGYATALTNSGVLGAWSASVSADFFRLLRVQPVRGRLPSPEEYREGAEPVAVVSYEFWRNRLGAPEDLSSQRIRMDLDFQVVGVLPPGFAFPRDAEIWDPIEVHGQTRSRTAHNWSAIGRLRPGVSLAEADRELDGITARMAEEFQPDFDATGAQLTPLQDLLTATTRRPLYLLLGASGLLLLAACTNLASTMLARGMARRQEVAVRIAIGAGRLRIVRQLFTESLLLALLGTAAGLLLAQWLLRLLVRLAPPTLRLEAVHLDGWVLLFTALVGISTTVLIGLFPAVRTSDAEPAQALRDGGRAGTSRGEQRVWNALVVVEVALAVTLLCDSGLLIRSFGRVLETEPGFRPDSVLTVSLNLPTAIYDEDRKIDQLWTRTLDALRAVPGVRSAGLTSALPLSGNNASGSFGIEGVPPGPAGYGPGNGGYRMVSEGYFGAMGIPLLSGRDFDGRDVEGGAGTVIINQSLATAWFRDRDPIGRRIQLQSGMDNQGDGWLRIIGVVGDVHHRSLTSAPVPETFLPLHQRPTRGYSVAIVLRTGVAPTALVPAVREVLRGTAPDAVPTFLTMRERLDRSQTDRQFTVVILGAFALLALLLAGAGIYGVVSYTAAQRTREMGIRMALGAVPSQVRGLVQRGAMSTVGSGLLLGMLLALATTRLLESLLYEVSGTDPLAYLSAAGLLALVAWLGSWLPARRMARLDPLQSIRAE